MSPAFWTGTDLVSSATATGFVAVTDAVTEAVTAESPSGVTLSGLTASAAALGASSVVVDVDKRAGSFGVKVWAWAGAIRRRR